VSSALASARARAVASTFAALAAAALGAAGCSAALDFDSELDLPCPCDATKSVCLTAANRCVAKGSVDDFKSCDPTASPKDDQCKSGSTCVNLRRPGDVAEGTGALCMPRCAPVEYNTPNSSAAIAQQCPRGTTCWPLQGGGPGEGVCYNGVCDVMPNTCAAPQQCVPFNGAGVCFTVCTFFDPMNGCIGDQTCHPVGASNVSACLSIGVRQEYELCNERDLCAKTSPDNRQLVCDKPEGSTDLARCYKACEFGGNIGCAPTETCQFARPNIQAGKNLGVCVRRGS
jgi:hypothetical protein